MWVREDERVNCKEEKKKHKNHKKYKTQKHHKKKYSFQNKQIKTKKRVAKALFLNFNFNVYVFS